MPIKIVTHLDDPEDPSVHPPIRPILGCEFVERTQEDGRGSGVPPPSDRPPPFRLLSSDIVQCKRRSEVVRKRLQVGRVVSLHIRQFNPWDHRMPNVYLHSPYIYGCPIHIRQDQTPRLSMGSVPSLNPSISVTSTTASFTKLKVDSLDYCEGGLGLLCEDSFNAWYGASI